MIIYHSYYNTKFTTTCDYEFSIHYKYDLGSKNINITNYTNKKVELTQNSIDKIIKPIPIIIMYRLLNLLTMSGRPSIIPEYIIVKAIRVNNITIRKLIKL